MNLAPLAPSDVLTLSGATVVVTILVSAILKLLAIEGPSRDRFGPAIAIGTGVVVVALFALAQAADLASGALAGLLAGAASMGAYDAVAKPLARAIHR